MKHPAPIVFADPPPCDEQAVLRRRADALAAVAVPLPPAGALLDVVEFVVGRERYALASRSVREVLSLPGLTPLPGTPSHIAGIVNVRGRILSVVDLRRFLGLPAAGLSDLNRIVVLCDERMEFGVLADHVVGTRAIDVGRLQPSLPTLSAAGNHLLLGIDADQLIVLCADALLRDRRLVVCQLDRSAGPVRADDGRGPGIDVREAPGHGV